MAIKLFSFMPQAFLLSFIDCLNMSCAFAVIVEDFPQHLCGCTLRRF